METAFLKRHPMIKDAFSITIFIACVLIGTLLINTFVFRSFSVVGPSMEKTLYTGDRLIVNRLPVTWSQIQNKSYVPDRGQIIVFKNPQFTTGLGDEFIVKRVIAFSGERVVLKDSKYTVYNGAHPDGFNPDDDNNGEPGSPTSGTVDTIVPSGELFVSGDHRQASYSYDSRNGLGTIPLYDIIGPVAIRVFPFDKIRSF
ncbi:signal peptidase I [Candidatus Saccharibacteria bacterium CG11_big_fil_rev_8_21_14_0_20_41_19]|nr:signal peptidase I [Candidatus Saccharibacteria bacterium]OIP85740.1 MAG: signal peptidase I [Candidatus Saccharibacteria bacterium CG2_30_41_52]PIQ70856.1 MAG: signal peptidase I [Candidatus Saccharibacteria bacterium CG11_big_fil_rev_8_21_14_0_20_41_19]PIZ60705.1 MAG: signal peptidase I [Candidatus Saccharibacteria bacterium CG_4_10_14_0_2_um_filter_41_11]PJC29645.1 MAG: signal peptidase I [Candidatus Saccharibacteria bacterium CG_4_9_14_0_2_um_filter_41_9]PJE65780.1 MAG: signal peptidase